MVEIKKDQYAVIGNPIEHSLSPQIHRLFATQTEQALTYEAILAEKNNFLPCLKQLIQQGYKGMNVTVPFKLDAYQCADEVSSNAEMAGAANTLTIDNHGKIYADNTDGMGLLQDLVSNHTIDISGKTILILGAGGAVRGVLAPLLSQSPNLIHIANRTVEKAESLLTMKPLESQTSLFASRYDALPERPFDIIINGTSASLSGGLPSVPSACVASFTCCYDMMYNLTEPTVFQKWAKQEGAGYALDGLGMLIEQAAYAFQLWRTVRPHSMTVYHTIRNNN